MSVEVKERDRPMRRESPMQDGKASRDSKPLPFRDNRAIRDNITNRSDPRSVRSRIFLGNLPTDKMNRQEVEDVFGQYGKVTAVSLHAHFGFVQYEDERGADSAVAKENGKVYYGRKLEVNLAGERKKDGRPPERDGRPPEREGRPPERDGRPPERDGRPPERDGRPPERDGRPPLRDGRPPDRERRPPPPFDRREREFDRERPRRSPPRDRLGDHNRFPPRFDGPPDRYRRSPSPPRDGFRGPYSRHDDPYERDRYRDDPYYRGPHDRPPLDRRGPPDRRDIPPNDRRDFPPPDRRDYPERRDDIGYGHGRPRSPDRRGGPPRDRHDDSHSRDRRDPYDRPREPYSDRRDDYYRRDDPYSQDYPPPKKSRSEYDMPSDDIYSSKPSMPVPTDCVIVVMNKQQRGYAEMVERRLKAVGLVVDVQIHGATPLTELLDSVARKGVLYAIVITSQHEVHCSVTVNILHGTPQEHRNMPLEDAMRFVGQNFERYMQDLRERSKKSSLSSIESAAAVTTTPATATGGSEISSLLSKAASGDTLTSEQLSKLIDNLSKQQKEISGNVSANGQGGVPASSSQPASQPAADAQSIAKQQAELQAKILSILNPGAKTTNTTFTGFQTQQSASQKPAEAASYAMQIPTAVKSTIAPLYPPAKPTFPAYGVSASMTSTAATTPFTVTGQYSKPSGVSVLYGVSSAPAVSAPQYIARAPTQGTPFTVPAQPTSVAKPAASGAYGSSQAYTSPVQRARSPAQGGQDFRGTSAATYLPKTSPVLSVVGATSTSRATTPQALPRNPSGGIPRAASPATRFATSTGTPRSAAPPGTLPRPRLAAPGATRPLASSGMLAPRGAAPVRAGSVSVRGGTPYSHGGPIPVHGGRGGSPIARGGTIPTRGGIPPIRGAQPGTPGTRGGLLSTRGAIPAVRGGPAGRGAPLRGAPVGRGTGVLRGMPRGAPAGRGGMVRGAPLMRGGPGGQRGRGIPSQRGALLSNISTVINRRGGGGRGH